MNQAELCDAFMRISRGVRRWMGRAQRVSSPSLAKGALPLGMTLRETTLTDYVVLRLLEECAPAVKVFTFPAHLETQTGADLELWIADRRAWLGLRIQCKVLSPGGRFEGLHYRLRNGAYQTDQLIQAAQNAPGCLPVYLLFVGPGAGPATHWRCPSCRPVTRCPPTLHSAWGNWWISAYKVRQLRPAKGLPSLRPNIVPWHCVVCCPAQRSSGVTGISATALATIFQDDDIHVQAVSRPPRYVILPHEGQLSVAAEELAQLLEGRGMRHLVVLDVE